MALYDNKYWLLSHIRNSFISTDDTGMCELVMVGETLPQQLVEELDIYPDSEDDDEQDEIEHESYDIQLDSDFRHRSYTAVRLEKMDQARKRAAKVKNIKWDNYTNCLEDPTDYFVRKDVSTRNTEPSKAKISLLTKQLEKCTNLPQNPYIEFAKFDGNAQVGVTTRKYKIFLTMLPEEQRNYPMPVCCIATATIQEFIGLILLKCSTIHGDFPLLSVNQYGLYITEEDGEVDRDFPCLDMKECVAKFGFSSLGLVEHKHENYQKRVSFNKSEMIGQSETSIAREAANIIALATEDTRQNTADMRIMTEHTNAMEAPLYKSFRVHIFTKMRGKVEVHLGISGDKIEIDPVQHQQQSGGGGGGSKAGSGGGGGGMSSAGGALLAALVGGRQRAISHQIDTIAWCETVDTRCCRTTFRVVYSMTFGRGAGAGGREIGMSSSSQLQTSASFKHYDFEADDTIAREIVQKVTQILELRSSSSRKEYLESLERKKLRKSGSLFK